MSDHLGGNLNCEIFVYDQPVIVFRACTGVIFPPWPVVISFAYVAIPTSVGPMVVLAKPFMIFALSVCPEVVFVQVFIGAISLGPIPNIYLIV